MFLLHNVFIVENIYKGPDGFNGNIDFKLVVEGKKMFKTKNSKLVIIIMLILLLLIYQLNYSFILQLFRGILVVF